MTKQNLKRKPKDITDDPLVVSEKPVLGQVRLVQDIGPDNSLVTSVIVKDADLVVKKVSVPLPKNKPEEEQKYEDREVKTVRRAGSYAVSIEELTDEEKAVVEKFMELCLTKSPNLTEA